MISQHRLRFSTLLLGLAGLPLHGAAQGATTSATIAVSATVLSYCTVAALPLAFGNYSPATAANATTSISVVCTPGTPFSIALDPGAGSGATAANRLMTGPGGSTLAYGLYSNAGMTTVWGNTAGTNTVSGTGTGLAQSLSVYGHIAAGQNVTAGLYADTVTVTLTY